MAKKASDLDSALAALARELAESLEKTLGPDTHREEIKQPGVKRQRYVAVTRLVSEFLLRAFGPNPMATEISFLGAALMDLERGIVHDFLEPVRIANRPGASSIAWFHRAFACVAVELLRQSEGSLKEATKYAAKKYPSLRSISDKPDGKLQDQIKRWLMEFRNRQAVDDCSQGLFGYLQEVELAASGDRTPSQNRLVADIYLQQAVSSGGMIKWRKPRSSNED